MPRKRRQDLTKQASNGPRPQYIWKTHGHSREVMRRAMRGFLLGWRIEDVSKDTGVKPRTLRSWRLNLLRYQSMNRPPLAALGRPHKLTGEDEDAVLEHLLRNGWMMQDEIIHWLENERGVVVSQPTISRLLKAKGWSRKKIARISRTRSEEARRLYKQHMSRFANEDVVHLDESIFNEKTGWRHYGYAPIGDEARYSADVRRGKTWSICGVLSVDGLLCHSTKKGYFNGQQFLEFITEVLIPALREKYSYRPMVVVMDNCSTHINRRVERALREAGYFVQYLPPYSPDFNPIELVWSVLKAWIRRWYFIKRRSCSDFGRFLEVALRESECDRFARAQYSHAADGIYLDREKLEEVQASLAQYKRGRYFKGLRPAEEVDFDDREPGNFVDDVAEEDLLAFMLNEG
jgi:transposase